MLFKSILTGTVLAGLAGGVVYFGTGGELEDINLEKAVVETKTAATKLAEQSTDSAKKKIEDLTKAKKIDETKILEVKPESPKSDGPKEGSFIERNTTEVEIIDTPEDDAEIDMTFEKAETVDTENVDKDDKAAQKKWLSQYLKKRESSETEETDDDVNSLRDDTELSIEDVEIEIKERILNSASDEATARFIVKDKNTSIPKWDEGAFEETYQTVLTEAENIDIIDLRNRAYLSLIDYSIREEKFDQSLDVIEKISQAELRDTARSNIAVGLARKGQSEAAFGVLDDVETDALSDVLRLQVIEAMTSPNIDN